MSLFKIRQFWSTTSEDDEYFDQNSLIVAKLNNENDYVITGSQSGVLRIFSPKCEITEDGELGGFNPNDVIVEKIFDSPILQISSGRLISVNQSTQLAVLHPRLISVYGLVIKSGKTDHGNQSYLNLLYEHKLRKSAANFVVGPFGGSHKRDFICVQSLDGLLSFFEQESQVFYTALPNFLLPGPLGYVISTDLFITSTSDWTIAGYKYKVLSEAFDESTDPIHSKPNIYPEWTYNLGESLTDIKVINDIINKETWIMILGERNLFSLNENGKVKFMKRLEFCPICFQAYVLDSNVFTIIAAETNMLLIYQNTTLKWSAHLDYFPVVIQRAFLENVKGALILLTEEGRLDCCYLGTEPSFFVAPPLNVVEIDFEKAEQELMDLEKTLKNYDDATVQGNIEKELEINIKVDSNIEVCTFEHNIKNATNNYMCCIKIDISPYATFQEVQISVSVQKPLKVVPNIQFYRNLQEQASLICYAFLDDILDVPTLSVEIKASVITSLGTPRALTRSAMLPASLILETSYPEKESKHKITISTNRTAVELTTLFAEFNDDDKTSPNSIAFKTPTNRTATILLAKSSERYRLQSDSLTTLSLLVEQLVSRLKRYHVNDDDYKISFSSALPSNEVFEDVNEHFRIKQTVNELQNEVALLSGQFRLIQKRIIAKYKAKNPTPLKSLELLLNDTYAEIFETTDKLIEERERLSKSQNDLRCSLYLVKQLVELLGLHDDFLNMIKSVFCGVVDDLEMQSWEDVTDASLCYLLRTVLAKTDKDRLRAPHTSFEEVKDLSKLEKHWRLVLERISKHQQLQESDGIHETENENREDTAEIQGGQKTEKPIGCQFGEYSTRLLSARKSLLRERHKINTAGAEDKEAS